MSYERDPPLSDTSKLNKKEIQNYFLEVLQLAGVLARRAGRNLPDDFPFDIPDSGFTIIPETSSPRKGEQEIDFTGMTNEKLFEVNFVNLRLR